MLKINVYVIEYLRHTFQKVLRITLGLETNDIIAKQAIEDGLRYGGWQYVYYIPSKELVTVSALRLFIAQSPEKVSFRVTYVKIVYIMRMQ